MPVTRILGIDPGSRITGYGIIDSEGNRLIHVAHGTLVLDETKQADKLRRIFTELSELLAEHIPHEVAIEKVFMHRNPDSALKLGQARGVAIAACAVAERSIHEYSANQIKQALVGRGHAAKPQIQHMVKVLLNLREAPVADAADALAVAVCHAHTRSSLQQIPGSKSARAGRIS